MKRDTLGQRASCPLARMAMFAISFVISAFLPTVALAEVKDISGTYRLSANENWTGYESVTFASGATVDLGGHMLTMDKFGGAALATTNDIATGYAGLSHLDTDGGQYVVLSDYEPAVDDRVEMCVRFLTPPLVEQFLFGSRSGALNSAFNLYLNNLTPRIDYSNKQSWFGMNLNTADDYTIVMDGKNLSFSVFADGVSVKPAVAMLNPSFTPAKPFSLFTVNSSTLRAKVRFYWFRVYGSDGVLKCNAVPAYDKASEVVGVYDLVSGNFYGNSGTGTFTAKGEARIVNTVEGYSRLSYLDTDGNSYAVLSDYSPAADDRVEMEVRFLARKNQFLFGSRQGAVNRAFNLYLANNSPRIDYSDKQPNFGQALNTTDDYVIVMDGKDLSFTVNYPGGVAVNTVAISDSSPFTPVSPFYLFTVNTVGTANANYAKVRFYRFKVYGSDGALKCDAVPAKRASDGAIGVYDRVAKAFYTKSGSGSFTAVGAAESELSNVVDPAEVHVDLAANTVSTNDAIVLVENVKLVKDGAGEFVAAKEYQSYTGGTVINLGKITLGTSTHPLGLGDGLQSVTVNTNATLDISNKASTTTCLYGYRLAGTLHIEGEANNWGWTASKGIFSSLELLGDAHITGLRFWFGHTSGILPVVMNGHTLYFDCDGQCNLNNNATSGSGTIVFTSGAPNFEYVTDFSTIDMVFMEDTRVHLGGNAFSVRGLKYDPSSWLTHSSSNQVVVYGRYFAGAMRPWMTMETGSTLDLSEVTGTWSADGLAPVAGASNRTFTEAGLVSFAEGAEITISLGDRNDIRSVIKSASPYLVTWSTEPSATFTLDAESYDAGYRIEKTQQGLKVSSLRSGLMIIVK